MIPTDQSPEISAAPDTGRFKLLRNPVVLPDGTKKIPMGSGMISGILGVGGMATVYEIWNSQLEITRAVKLLHPNYTEEAKQRFQTEIKITAKLHHPNIIEIHAVGEWDKLPYIEMERIDGQTLETILLQRGAFPIEVCVAIGVMIGRALRYSHNQDYVIYGKNYHGVIHRDLKPSNLMVTTRGILKLMDFGIARPTDASIHTTDGSILGTMQYLSPEQLDGKDPDIRTDIYSVGTILYELLTGDKTFPEINASRLMLSKIKNDYKSLDRYALKIPVKLRRLVHRCLIQDRERRIPDATVFLNEITKIFKSMTTQTPEQVMKQFLGTEDKLKRVIRLRKKFPVMVLAGLLVVLMAGVGLKTYGSRLGVFFQEKQVKSEVFLPDSLEVSTPVITETTIEDLLAKPEVQLEQRTIPKSQISVPVSKKVVNLIEPVLPVQEVSLIEKLCNQHGTKDIQTVFVNEVQSHNYENALKIFADIPADQIGAEKTLVYKMRALQGLGKKAELKEFLNSNNVRDGEFYLVKGKFFLDAGVLSEAEKYLELSSKTSAAFSENKNLRLDRLYFMARCKSSAFDLNPTISMKNSALDKWFEVKSELQTAKDHRYFVEAEQEMQRITEKSISQKG